jgi:hypothetical protein
VLLYLTQQPSTGLLFILSITNSVQNQKLETQSKPLLPVLLPSLPVLIVKKVQKDFSEAYSTKLYLVVSEELLLLLLL